FHLKRRSTRVDRAQWLPLVLSLGISSQSRICRDAHFLPRPQSRFISSTNRNPSPRAPGLSRSFSFRTLGCDWNRAHIHCPPRRTGNGGAGRRRGAESTRALSRSVGPHLFAAGTG